MQKLEVVTLFQTSLGLFEFREEAEKKKNRIKIPYDRFGPMEYEDVVEVKVLKVQEQGVSCGIGEPTYFALQPIVVR